MTLAWHFVRRDAEGRMVMRDGAVAVVGEWTRYHGPAEPEICKCGLHASRRAIDALQYLEWDNAVACLVEVDGVVSEHTNDKLVATARRIVAAVPCDDILVAFARKAALAVIHLWDAPPVVREYLDTGREDIRAAARAAAWAAAGDAAWDAAGAAAWAAAGAAARAAARAAAWAAAGAAAGDAARDAAGDAAGAAAGAAAGDAAGAAAGNAQNKILEGLLREAMGLPAGTEVAL